MQNIVINMCEKFHYDRSGNDRTLGNRRSDNNNPNSEHKNNVRGHWRHVSRSNKISQRCLGNAQTVGQRRVPLCCRSLWRLHYEPRQLLQLLRMSLDADLNRLDAGTHRILHLIAHLPTSSVTSRVTSSVTSRREAPPTDKWCQSPRSPAKPSYVTL